MKSQKTNGLSTKQRQTEPSSSGCLWVPWLVPVEKTNVVIVAIYGVNVTYLLVTILPPRTTSRGDCRLGDKSMRFYSDEGFCLIAGSCFLIALPVKIIQQELCVQCPVQTHQYRGLSSLSRGMSPWRANDQYRTDINPSIC